VIEPKFNKERLGDANAIGNAIKNIAGPIAKFRDKKMRLDTAEANKQLLKTQKDIKKAWQKKKAAVAAQDKAARTYIQDPIRAKKGTTLTPAQKKMNIARKKQNEAAKTYTSYGYDKVTAKSTGSKGRPNTNAAKKTATPGTPKMPTPTVNKTGARNVRKSTKVTPVTKTPGVKPVNGVGRRSNGAPKKRMR
jgi:hypothetical protein